MATFKIDVTQDDIANGERCVARRCPIALAVRRALGLKTSVSTHRVSFFYRPDEPPVGLTLPKEVVDFIYNFDEGNTVEPFSFELTFPEPIGA